MLDQEGALKPSGSYAREDGRATVNLTLKLGETIVRRSPEPVTGRLADQQNDLPALAKQIAGAILELAAEPQRASGEAAVARAP